MSTKRVKMRELKRKQKQQRKMLIIGCAAAVVAIAVLLSLMGLDAYNRNFIMTFEGKKISVNDFRFCAIFAQSEENFKEEALDTLLSFLVIEKAANENGLALTQEEMDGFISYAGGLKGYYWETYGMDLSFITDQRMAEIFGLDSLRAQLVDKYTADIEIDENDFRRNLADYIEKERVDYIDMNLKYILSYDESIMETCMEELSGGADFDEMVVKYSEWYDEETGIDTYTLKELGMSGEDNELMLALGEGEISHIVDLGGLYGIFYVDSVRVPDAQEIEDKYRDIYTGEKKEAMFEEIVAGWMQEADYKVNQRAYEAV